MQDQQNELINRVLAELDDQINVFNNSSLSRETIGKFWFDNIDKAYKKLKNDPVNLVNFRRNNLVVADYPSGTSNRSEIYYKMCRLLPSFLQPHPAIKACDETYERIEDLDLRELVLANPISNVGAPLCYVKNGIRYTRRWIRHIYFLSLFKQYLESHIHEIKTILDIGSSYGAFPYLMKKNYPDSHFIMIDLPEQNTVAHYYLKSEMPDCRIAGFEEIREVGTITRDFVESYDFILVPCFYLDRLDGGIADLVTNFVSLPEMSREWFDLYLQSSVFTTSKYFYTVNPVVKEENTGVKITVLDMPFNDYEQIHFDICPFFQWQYLGKHVRGLYYRSEKVPRTVNYEYIGKRKG